MAGSISVTQAAEKLGLSRARVNMLIKQGRLPATKVGSFYVIDPKDLTRVQHRKPGRPRKPK